MEIDEEDVPTCSDPNPLNCDRLSLSLRDYISPGTRRGPNEAGKLAAILIPLAVPED